MTARSAAIAASGLLCFWLLAGCGKLADEDSSGKGGTPSGGENVPADTTPGSTAPDTTSVAGPITPGLSPIKRTDLALQQLATGDCTRWKSCGISGTAVFAGTWGDDANCLAAKQDYYATLFATKGVTVTQAQIDLCAARQALTPCETNIVECEFVGTEPDGAACNTDAQCASGGCGGYDDASCGHCVARVPAGGACSSDFECAIGLMCNVATKRCMSPLPAGSACEASAELCGPGLTCLGGSCGQRLPIGAACSPGSGTIHFGYYDACAGGSWCNSETHVCTAFPKLTKTAALGEPCDRDTSCQGSKCDSQGTKTCVPFGISSPAVCR